MARKENASKWYIKNVDNSDYLIYAIKQKQAVNDTKKVTNYFLKYKDNKLTFQQESNNKHNDTELWTISSVEDGQYYIAPKDSKDIYLGFNPSKTTFTTLTMKSEKTKWLIAPAAEQTSVNQVSDPLTRFAGKAVNIRMDGQENRYLLHGIDTSNNNPTKLYAMSPQNDLASPRYKWYIMNNGGNEYVIYTINHKKAKTDHNQLDRFVMKYKGSGQITLQKKGPKDRYNPDELWKISADADGIHYRISPKKNGHGNIALEKGKNNVVAVTAPLTVSQDDTKWEIILSSS